MIYLNLAITLRNRKCNRFSENAEDRDLSKMPSWRNLSHKKHQEVMASDLIKTVISNMPEQEFKTQSKGC